MEFSYDLRQFNDYQVKEHIILTHADLKAINSKENPDNVAPIRNVILRWTMEFCKQSYVIKAST